MNIDLILVNQLIDIDKLNKIRKLKLLIAKTTQNIMIAIYLFLRAST
jgi:hypothetical protein